MNITDEMVELNEWNELVVEAKELGWSTDSLNQVILGYLIIKEAFAEIGIEIKFNDLFSVVEKTK